MDGLENSLIERVRRKHRCFYSEPWTLNRRATCVQPVQVGVQSVRCNDSLQKLQDFMT